MKKILVVEDDPLARQILNVRLKPAYEVIVTGDAMSAITEARKQKPDLIILDLGLPAGGGFSVLQRLKAIPALAVIPVLVVSGLDQATNERKALEAGANAYLQKTPTNETLIATVRALLGD
ncbi:MAG TPA: response regulator [Thermoanaerobaculia bacterium]